MIKKHLRAIPAILLTFASAPAIAQEDDDGDQVVVVVQDFLSRIIGNPNVIYRSNNPCLSGRMDDGTPVNCNNAIGVEAPRQVIIVHQRHRPQPFRFCWANRGCHIEWHW